MEIKDIIYQVNFDGVENIVWSNYDKSTFGSSIFSRKIGPLYDWITWRDEYFKNVKKWDTVVQAGGMYGLYPLFYSKYFKNVITFEPVLLNYRYMNINCGKIQNIKMYRAALSDTRFKLKLVPSQPTNMGENKILYEHGDVDTIVLDDLKLDSCDLIHLDVEHHESYALKGAIKTIKKFYPTIILEGGHGYEVIKKLGYKDISPNVDMRDKIYIRK